MMHVMHHSYLVPFDRQFIPGFLNWCEVIFFTLEQE
jgi:hypothetical protein